MGVASKQSLQQMIKHSIIIPTAGRPTAIKAAIESVLAVQPEDFAAELIVVDNNTNEELAADLFAYCQKWHDRLRYVREPAPGLSAARHRGAADAQGEWLTFLDDDVEVSSTWLHSIQNAFVDPIVAMVGGPSIPRFTSTIPAWFWDFFSKTPYGGWMNPWLSLLDIGKDVQDIDPNYIWGLNFSIRKQVMYKCGGFHLDLVPAEYQRWQGDGETGLTMKVKEFGFKARYVQGALLYHLCGPERLNIDYFMKRAFYQGVCNSYTLIRSEKLSSFTIQGGQSSSIRHFFRSIAGRVLKQLWSGSPWANEAKIVKYLSNKAEQDGWRFHQNEIANDPKLLEWVRRHDYFETDLRELKR